MDDKQKNNTLINTSLKYIKINHKNKIDILEELEYYNELMNLANTLQSGEQNIGVEINKFFQYILPENKEGDLLKVNIAISNKYKNNKKYAHQCLNDIMNMKEKNNLVLTKDFSEKLSAIIKEIYGKIKKSAKIKTFNDLIKNAKECLYQAGNIFKKYTEEKTINIEVFNNNNNSSNSNISSNNDDIGYKDYN